MAFSEHTSSPTPVSFKTTQEELAYYKAQYEHLEGELQEFQASSKELEAELEKDVEASEKRERSLKEKVEALQYEVEDWKTRCKQSKAEASQAQNTLQKEITALRETNRALQLKLRDIEVANDDYERQARNTTSSLEDLESKYNISLERGVIMEEEIKAGEQERENLRIEAQRLRDELSDLKVEAEITHDRLRNLENGTRRHLKRTSEASDSKVHLRKSPGSEKSVASTSTRGMSTPTLAKSEASGTNSEAQTPPSPPISDVSGPFKATDFEPMQAKSQQRVSNANTTPRPGFQRVGHPRHTRGASLLHNGVTTPTPSFARRTAGTTPRPRGAPTASLPRSGSLYQIRGLIGKMAKLEERVHSARSKLPAPTTTPPQTSPQTSTYAAGDDPGSDVPSNVTVRSSKRHLASSGTETQDTSSTPSYNEEGDGVGGRRLTQRYSRISMSGPSLDGGSSRPSSRASNASHTASQFARPTSRASHMGRPATATTTATDQYQNQGSLGELRRPRSSLSGMATPSRAHRQSISSSSSNVVEEVDTPTQSTATLSARRTTLDKSGLGSSIPTPSSILRRQSGRMGPPGRVPSQTKQQYQEVGETF